MAAAVVVLDIGKTHVKLFAIEPHGGKVLEARQVSNRSIDTEPYLHVDVDRIWAWLLDALADLGKTIEIEAIVPCAHGSSVALVDEAGLVLPMMDYEAEFPADLASAYADIAPDFTEVYCPTNPGALTLARQLFWQSRRWPEAFSRARWILPAPQYWGWRLTGQRAAEVTSIGAQTHLWNPKTGTVTDLAKRQSWADRLPPFRRPFDELGKLSDNLTKRLGLKKSVPVLTGIHDSNANYARYLATGLERFTLISSGTWLITFDTDLPLERLDPARDMVANVDLQGRPVACTRFMGGREFADVAKRDGLAATPTVADLEKIIASETMALPSFTHSGGPFPGTGNKGRIVGPEPTTPEQKNALATLYVALVTDTDLDLLASTGDIIIDGTFAENPLYPRLLATLRPNQTVTISRDSDGTALGAALLWGWNARTGPVRLDLEQIQPLQLPHLADYKARWHAAIGWD